MDLKQHNVMKFEILTDKQILKNQTRSQTELPKNCSPTFAGFSQRKRRGWSASSNIVKRLVVGEKKRQERGIWGKKVVSRQSFGRRAAGRGLK